MSTFYIGLKIGSNNTWIYKAGNGLVLREPTLVAVGTNSKNREIKAFGNDAISLIGRSGAEISVISPISNGLIRYDDLTTQMLRGFLKKIFPTKTFAQKIKAILCVPLGITSSEKKKFEIVCFKAGITDVCIVPEILSYAVGSEMNLSPELSHLIVNIGGDTTNIAVISGYRIISGYNFSIGGSLINIAITKYIEETYNLRISPEMANQLKLDICSLFSSFSASTKVIGINTRSMLKEERTIQSSELYPIVDYYYGKIAEAVLSLIASSKPETAKDIAQNGIYYFGGATAIIGFEKYMFDKTGYKVNFSSMSHSNVIGIGELIKFPQILKKIIKNNW